MVDVREIQIHVQYGSLGMLPGDGILRFEPGGRITIAGLTLRGRGLFLRIALGLAYVVSSLLLFATLEFVIYQVFGDVFRSWHEWFSIPPAKRQAVPTPLALVALVKFLFGVALLVLLPFAGAFVAADKAFTPIRRTFGRPSTQSITPSSNMTVQYDGTTANRINIKCGDAVLLSYLARSPGAHDESFELWRSFVTPK